MEVIDRVFKISLDDEGEGTGFALDIDGKQYLITAKHVLGITAPSYIRIYHDDCWKRVFATPVGSSNVDVAVFSLPMLIAHPDMILPAEPGGFIMAQDVYFAGFPLGLFTEGIESPFPTPLIKKAIISGKQAGGLETPFYLDGHVNPGFSGGPVFLKQKNHQKFVISMIISSFEGTREPVFNNDKEHPNLTVIANSGIIHALSISNAISLIKENPIGFPIN